MRSSPLDMTVPSPNFWCSTWAPWEKPLEAIDLLNRYSGGVGRRCDQEGKIRQMCHANSDLHLSKSEASLSRGTRKSERAEERCELSDRVGAAGRTAARTDWRS